MINGLTTPLRSFKLQTAPTVKSLQKVFAIFDFYRVNLRGSWLAPLPSFPKGPSCHQYCDFLVVVSRGREDEGSDHWVEQGTILMLGGWAESHEGVLYFRVSYTWQ